LAGFAAPRARAISSIELRFKPPISPTANAGPL
jgi:hypothetical protein